jgi:hypothetical protein
VNTEIEIKLSHKKLTLPILVLLAYEVIFVGNIYCSWFHLSGLEKIGLEYIGITCVTILLLLLLVRLLAIRKFCLVNQKGMTVWDKQYLWRQIEKIDLVEVNWSIQLHVTLKSSVLESEANENIKQKIINGTFGLRLGRVIWIPISILSPSAEEIVENVRRLSVSANNNRISKDAYAEYETEIAQWKAEKKSAKEYRSLKKAIPRYGLLVLIVVGFFILLLAPIFLLKDSSWQLASVLTVMYCGIGILSIKDDLSAIVRKPIKLAIFVALQILMSFISVTSMHYLTKNGEKISQAMFLLPPIVWTACNTFVFGLVSSLFEKRR